MKTMTTTILMSVMMIMMMMLRRRKVIMIIIIATVQLVCSSNIHPSVRYSNILSPLGAGHGEGVKKCRDVELLWY